MSMPWFLALLELPPHADERAVRRAYAMRVKVIDPASDPVAFARLREAYEAARAWVADEDHDDAAALSPPMITESATVSRPEATIRLEDVPVGDTPTQPVVVPVNPQEQAVRLVERLAARIADGSGRDIRTELEACTAELRLQYIDAPGIFEEALIDRLAKGLMVRRASVFAIATEHFHWQEIGHVAALGPKGMWIEAVEAQRMAWNGQAPLRANRLSLIETAESVTGPLPTPIVRRWFEVRDDFRRYPAYLGLYLAPPRQHEWASRYDALPVSERQALETPVKKRRWHWPNLRSTYPAWGFFFIALVGGLGRLLAPALTDEQPDPVPVVSAANTIGDLRVTASEPVPPSPPGKGWIFADSSRLLDVHIGSSTDGRADGQAVISVTVRNLTDTPVYVPTSRTPLFTPAGHLTGNVFDVVDEDGAKAAFVGQGREASPSEPNASYGTIGPGEIRKHHVDLSIDYQLAPGRRYKVSYVQPVSRSVHLDNLGEASGKEELDASNEVEFELPAKLTLLVVPTAEPDPGKKCTADQLAKIYTARSSTTNWTLKALTKLKSNAHKSDADTSRFRRQAFVCRSEACPPGAIITATDAAPRAGHALPRR